MAEPLYTLRGLLAGALAALVIGSVAAPAEASTRACRNIEAQLAALSGQSGGRQAARYQQAAERQREQLRLAERQAARSGCFGHFSIGSRDVCRSLSSTIDRMRGNLASLERRGGGGRADNAATRRERARLTAALDENGCRGTRRSTSPPKQVERRDGNLFEQLFGNREPEIVPDPRRVPPPIARDRVRTTLVSPSIRSIGPQGNFRTLCVRSCDGYFFPVSYNASGTDLDRDEAMCRNMCPGTEVALYFHRVPDEETDQMISRFGQPYTELPTAFRYRQAGFSPPEGCGCESTRNFSIIGGERALPSDTDGPDREETAAELPRPSPRPDPLTDPETIQNHAGGLDAGAVQRLTDKGDPSRGPAAGERRIRVVGPAFLPDPEAAAVPQAPDPLPAR